MAKTVKNSSPLSPLVTKRLGAEGAPVTLLTELYALHSHQQIHDQVDHVLTPEDWNLLRAAVDTSTLDIRRDPRGELQSLVTLYADYEGVNTPITDLLAKLKKLTVLQCTAILFAIARAEAHDIHGFGWQHGHHVNGNISH